MDNLTHSLFALTLARTRLGRASPLATPALLVAANLPDLDIVVRPFGGSAAYLAYHRGITHAAFGLIVQIVVLTFLWWRLERRIAPAEAGSKPFARGGPLLPVAVGLFTHPLLDGLNVYGIRPWLPFDGAWIYGDLLFVVDPWVWLLLGATACLAGPRRRGGDIGWAVVATFMVVLVYTPHEHRPPLGLLLAFGPTVVAVAVLRARGAGIPRAAAMLRGATIAGVVYLVALGLLRERAERLALAEVTPQLYADESIVRLVRSPRIADPRRWTVIVETERRVLWEEIDVFDGRLSGREADHRLGDPRVRAAAATDAGRKWASFVRVPVARVEKVGGAEIVKLSDARYWFTDWCTVVVPVSAGGATPPASR